MQKIPAFIVAKRRETDEGSTRSEGWANEAKSLGAGVLIGIGRFRIQTGLLDAWFLGQRESKFLAATLFVFHSDPDGREEAAALGRT